jgi:hypothetical protein
VKSPDVGGGRGGADIFRVAWGPVHSGLTLGHQFFTRERSSKGLLFTLLFFFLLLLLLLLLFLLLG